MSVSPPGIEIDKSGGDLSASPDAISNVVRILEQVCLAISAATGALLGLKDPDGNLVVVAAHGTAEPLRGSVSPIDRTFQSYALRSGRPEIISDAIVDPRLTPDIRAISAQLSVRSCLSIPLMFDENAIGVLAIVAPHASAFIMDDANLVASSSISLIALIASNGHLSRLLKTLLGPRAGSHESVAAERLLGAVVLERDRVPDQLRDSVKGLLTSTEMRAVFQPILDLDDRELVAFEGLCRFPGNPTVGPDQWFALGHRYGLGIELELKALRTILAAAKGISDRYALHVNLSSLALLSSGVQDVLAAARRNLVVELTEHEPAPELLSANLAPLRQCGIRLAVDDAGSGFAGLTMILRLRPDIIKLDRELTSGMHNDPVKRALARALSQFAQEVGATTIAEGVENEQQVRLLRDFGYRYGQGFYLGRPHAVPLRGGW